MQFLFSFVSLELKVKQHHSQKNMDPALCHSPLTRCGTARCTQRAMETSNGPILTEQQLRVPRLQTSNVTVKTSFFHWVTRTGFLLSISLDRCQLSPCFFSSPRKGQQRWNKWSSQEFLLPLCCSGTRRDNGETPRGSRSNGDCARQTISVALEQRRCVTDKDEPRSSPIALEPPIHRTNGKTQMGGTLSVYFTSHRERRFFFAQM